METKMETGNPVHDNFYPTIKKFLEPDQVTYPIDGERVHGYRGPDCNGAFYKIFAHWARSSLFRY